MARTWQKSVSPKNQKQEKFKSFANSSFSPFNSKIENAQTPLSPLERTSPKSKSVIQSRDQRRKMESLSNSKKSPCSKHSRHIINNIKREIGPANFRSNS